MVVNHHGDKPILNSGRIKLQVTFKTEVSEILLNAITAWH